MTTIYPTTVSIGDPVLKPVYIPDEVLDLSEKYKDLLIPYQVSEFYVETAKMFSKTLLQEELASMVCYNFSVPTMKEPIKISQKVFKYCIQEYSSHGKITSTEVVKQLQVCESITNKHLTFLKQLNENTLFNKASGKTPIIIPDLELLEYFHSYSSIRLLLNTLNLIIDSGSKGPQPSVPYMEIVIEYVKPMLLFFLLIGTDLMTLIERAKVARSENNESCDYGAISVNLKHLQDKLPKKLYSALEQSISIALENSEVAALLLNESGIAYYEHSKKLREIAESKASHHQIIGELMLLKILNDFTNERNEASIVSVLLGILRLYDLDDSWQAKAIFTLLEESIQIKEGHQLSLIDDCVSFLFSYWKQGDWTQIVKQERNRLLESTLSDPHCKLVKVSQELIKLWRRYASYGFRNFESVLESEFLHQISSLTILNWLSLLEKIYDELIEHKAVPNALFLEANAQIVDWLYSLMLNHDFQDNLLPISIFRKTQRILVDMISPSSSTARVYQPLTFLKKIRQLCDWIDLKIFQVRDLTSLEEQVVLNYIHLLFTFLTCESDAENTTLSNFQKSRELAEFMDYKWQSEKGSALIKCTIFRLTFDSFEDFKTDPLEVTDLPGESLLRYFKTVDSATFLKVHDLKFILGLSKQGFSFFIEFAKFPDSMKKWIINSWTTEANCFHVDNSEDTDNTMEQYINLLRWNKTNAEAPEYIKTFISFVTETSATVADWLKATVSECYDTIEDKNQSDYKRKKLQNKLYRVSCLVWYWFEAHRALQEFKSYYPELKDVKFQMQTVSPLIEMASLIPNPLFDLEPLLKQIKELDGVREVAKELTVTRYRTLIMLGKAFDQSSDVKNLDYPQKLARIGYRSVINRDNPKITVAIWASRCIDNLIPVKKRTKSSLAKGEAVSFLSTTQTEDLSDDLVDLLWNTLQVFSSAIIAEKRDSPNQGTTLLSIFQINYKKHWQKFIDAVIPICSSNEASRLEIMLEKLTRILIERCKALNLPEDMTEYLLLVLFFEHMLKSSLQDVVKIDQLSDWLKHVPFEESFVALDFLQKMIQVLDSNIPEEEAQNLLECVSDITSPLSSKFIVRIGFDSLIHTKEPNSILVNMIKDWDKLWLKRNGQLWRDKLLKTILQNCLFELVVANHQLENHPVSPINEFLHKLKSSASFAGEFSIQGPVQFLLEENFPNQAYSTTKFFFEVVADSGLITILRDTALLEKIPLFVDVLASLLPKRRSRFVDSVKSILNSTSPFSIEEARNVLPSIMNDFLAMSTISDGNYFEFIIFHLVPILTKEFKALTLNEAADFLLVVIKLLLHSENTKDRAVLIEFLRTICPELLNCLRQAIICYHNDTTGIIQGCQEYLKSLSKQIDELVPLLCKLLCKTTELQQDLALITAIYELIIAYSAEIGSTKLFFELEIIEFLFSDRLIEQNLIIQVAILIFHGSFQASQYLEALVKFCVFHTNDGLILTKDVNSNSLGSKIFNSTFPRISNQIGLKFLKDNLLESEDIIGFKNKVNLNTVHSPLETDFFNVITQFANHSSAVYIDHLIKIVVKGLTNIGLEEDTNITPARSDERNGIFALQAICGLIAEYPFLGPYLFFKDISNLFEQGNPVVKTISNSVVTQMINARTLSKKTDMPFGVYLIEILSLAATPHVYELLAVLLALPVPLLFKDENEPRGYLSFNMFIRNCVETRVLEGLAKLNSAFEPHSKLPYEPLYCREIIRETMLALFIPMVLWPNDYPLAEKSDFTNRIWEELVKWFLSFERPLADDADHLVDWVFRSIEGCILSLLSNSKLSESQCFKLLEQVWLQSKFTMREGKKMESVDLILSFSGENPREKKLLLPQTDYKAFAGLSLVFKNITESLDFSQSLNSLRLSIHGRLTQELIHPIWGQLYSRNALPDFDSKQASQLLGRLSALTSIKHNPTQSIGKIDKTVQYFMNNCQLKVSNEIIITESAKTNNDSKVTNKRYPVKKSKTRPKEQSTEENKTEDEKLMLEEEKDVDTLGGSLKGFKEVINSLDSDGLCAKIQEGEKILKLFLEKEALDDFVSSLDPYSLIPVKKAARKGSETTVAFIEQFPEESKIFVLAAASPETIAKFPESLRVLAGNIRLAIRDRTKDMKKKNKDADVDSWYIPVSEEIFNDMTDNPPSKTLRDKDEEEHKKLKSAKDLINVSSSRLESLLKLSASAVVFIAKQVLVAYINFNHLQHFLIYPPNLFAILDTLLALTELHFRSDLPSSILSLNTLKTETFRQQVLANLLEFLSVITGLLPPVPFIENKSLIKNRISELQENKMTLQEDESDLLLDRFALLFAAAQLNALNSTTLESFLRFFERVFDEDAARPHNKSSFLQKKKSILPLIKIVTDNSAIGQEFIYDSTEIYMKSDEFKLLALSEISPVLHNLFKELHQKIEKIIVMVKSKAALAEIQAICNQSIGADLKYIGYYMHIATLRLFEDTKPSEDYIKFAETFTLSDITAEVVLNLYELLDKLSDTIPAAESSKHSFVFYLVTVISFHMYLYNLQNENKHESLTQKSLTTSNLDQLELSGPELSRYVSKDNDLEDLGATTLSKSYSEIRRTKFEGIDIDYVFSHLSSKVKTVFQNICLRKYRYIPAEKVIKELSKQRHWITLFQTKLEHLWENVSQPLSNQRKRRNINIRRSHLVEDSLKNFRFVLDDEKKRNIKIEFVGEDGMDGGGIRRTWFSELFKMVTDPNFGLFKTSGNKRNIQPSPLSGLVPNHLELFEFVGLMVAKAIQNNDAIDVHFSKSFYKHLIGKPLYLSDLEDIDAQLHKSLKWVLENNVEGLGQTFTYEYESLESRILLPLKPDGENIEITETNKREFVRLMCQKKLTEEIQDQIRAFKKGFHIVLPEKAIGLLNPSDLEYVIAGEGLYDFAQWKENMKYEGKLSQTDNLVQWFWEILASFTQEELTQFLYFLTGSTRVPVGGFKSEPLGLKLNFLFKPSDLPIAHTCYYELEIPRYPDKETMKEKIVFAMFEGTGGFAID